MALVGVGWMDGLNVWICLWFLPWKSLDGMEILKRSIHFLVEQVVNKLAITSIERDIKPQ